MKKRNIAVVFGLLLLSGVMIAQPTPGFREALEKALADLSTISIPELKADDSYRAKGNLKRSYFFKEAGQTMPYRLYVPGTYQEGKTPLVVLLHGGGGNENSLVDGNNKISLLLAEKYGYMVLSPMGYTAIGAYGSPLRLPAVFGKQDEQAKQLAAFANDTTRQRILSWSEKDVLNALDLVISEYKPDMNNIFLAGHSMGSGGTWYLGGKYAEKWKAIAPMSGPFIDERSYPWEVMKTKPIFISEGTGATPSLESSRILSQHLKKEGFNTAYMEVEANHGEMTSLIFPHVFEFFNAQLKKK
ncbi:MAG: hypothetical protein KDC49_20720 [Saprospiraceae bacterium]|nr:hypothetical protein [Saprospiraceae bacterium]